MNEILIKRAVNTEQKDYKRVLNSASGTLGGNFDTNLRANNRAMTMRKIGQLFTFSMGRALALEGADVYTNKNGITIVNTKNQNENIHVDCQHNLSIDISN